MRNMKKIIAGILCAALLWLSLGVFSHALSPAQVKFLVLGDSIAAGSGVQDKKDAYAWLVAEAKGYELTNYGAGGDISADLLRKVTSDETIRAAIRAADIIEVSIGGNDLLHAEDFTSMVINGLLGDYAQLEPIMDEFRENFAGIIAGIRALNPDAMLIVQTLYNAAFPVPSLRKAYGEASQGINAGIYAYLAKNPDAFLLADVYAAFEPRSGVVFIDMTHPSSAGHAVIASVLLGVIDAAPAQLPPANAALDLLVRLLKPALTVLDWVLIGGVLRVVYGVLGPVLPLVS